jgi:hypothetical protein
VAYDCGDASVVYDVETRLPVGTFARGQAAFNRQGDEYYVVIPR